MEYQGRRLHKRITTSLPINYAVLEADKKEHSNTICKDISSGGLRVILDKFYPPKTKFLLKINFPEINMVVEAMAETVWSFNLRFSNNYAAGLRFLSMDSPNRQMISEFILSKELISCKKY